MTEDPKAAISAALADPDLVAPFGVLGYAAAWAAQSLTADAGRDDVVAFEQVIALDDALPRLGELFLLVPALVRTASPGGPVSERLAAYEAELGHQRAALAEERKALEAMRDLERQLTEAENEREGLRAAIEALEHRRVLARELPALRARQAELEAIVTDAADRDGDHVLGKLDEALGRLRELSQAQRALLEARNAQLLTDIAVAGEVAERERARRDALAAELAATQADAEQLKLEYQQNLPALEAQRQADHDLVVGLTAAGLLAGESALDRVQAELVRIGNRLSAVDESLKPLLDDQATRYAAARQVRTWSGQSR
jgi:chromosome segregation ATPase